MNRFTLLRSIVLLIGLLLSLNYSASANAQTSCGTWSIDSQTANLGVEIKQVVTSPGSDCHSVFRFHNTTSIPILGGGHSYKLKGLPFSTQLSWSPGQNLGNETYLLPALDVELTTTPLAPSKIAYVTVGGAMTLDSFAFDSALFLVEEAIPSNCLVPKETLVYLALRSRTIIQKTAELAADLDLVGATQEFSQVGDNFYNEALKAAEEAGFSIGKDCLADSLKSVIGKAAIILKISFDYIVWVPGVIADNITHWGQESLFTLNYAPAPSIALATATPTQFVPAMTPTHATTKNQIAFVSDRDGNNEIYVMNADGSNQRRLTNNKAFDGDPSWSPDGRFIAFTSGRDGNQEIYIMNSDGTSSHNLTNNPAADFGPSWSPDGRFIAFLSTRTAYLDAQVFVMNADGTNPHLLTNSISRGTNHPVWSPNSRFILFNADRFDANGIYVVGVDGTNAHRLNNDPATDFEPSWSPDGRFIAFQFFSRPDNNSAIYLMNADGTRPRRLTNGPGRDGQPTWSADGLFIVFVSDRDGNQEIYVMNADGTNPHNISNNSAADNSPAWSPR